MTQRARSEKFERGLKTRREVLGSDYVDGSIARANDFNWDLQKLTTEWCWDEIWNRPGLDRKNRSLLNLGMISALNRPHELKIHIRGAVTNGVTREEMKEVFLQVAVYCGMPAALDAFRTAQQVFEEMESERG